MTGYLQGTISDENYINKVFSSKNLSIAENNDIFMKFFLAYSYLYSYPSVMDFSFAIKFLSVHETRKVAGILFRKIEHTLALGY